MNGWSFLGGRCGSHLLNIAFQEHIKTLIGRSQYEKIGEKSRRKMLKEFEFGIKRAIDSPLDETYSVDLKGVRDDPLRGILDDTISIKP